MTGIVTPKRRGLAWSGPPHLAFQEGYALSTPKPYLGFGLKVRLTLPAASDAPRGAHALSSELLDALQLRHRFHPYPALDITEFVYPCLVVQVKADYSSLYQAENQVATAAAKALVMLEELRETSSSDDQAQRAPMSLSSPLRSMENFGSYCWPFAELQQTQQTALWVRDLLHFIG